MKKLRLDLNALRVEAFTTVPDRNGRQGTVDAHQASGFCTPICDFKLTQSCESCEVACLGTYAYSQCVCG